MEDYFEHHIELCLSGGGRIVIQGHFNVLNLDGIDLHTVKLILAVIEDHKSRISDGKGNPELVELAALSQ